MRSLILSLSGTKEAMAKFCQVFIKQKEKTLAQKKWNDRLCKRKKKWAIAYKVATNLFKSFSFLFITGFPVSNRSTLNKKLFVQGFVLLWASLCISILH